MNHEDLSQLLQLYSMGALDAEERDELEAHLAQKCPECEAGMRRALKLNSFLATLPEPINPPRRLRRRILASIGAEPVSGRFWIGAWAFASACLAIVLAIVAIDSHQRAEQLAQAREQLRSSVADLNSARAAMERSSAEVQRLHAAIQILNTPDTKQVSFGKNRREPTSGRVFVSPGKGVLLLASNLPSLPPGKMYEFWLIPKGGAPLPAGMFQVDGQGNAMHLFNGPTVPNLAAVAVSVEPESGSQAPTTKPLIVAAV